MQRFKQISFLVFISVLLYLIVGCVRDKPNQPIENTIDTIAFHVGDTLADTTGDTIIDTTTIPDNVMITIERTRGAIQGQQKSIEISMQNTASNNFSMGGFDFLLGYDASILTFQSADPGQFLNDCGWEYFTYRYGQNSNCGECPSGEIRVTAIAEINNGQDNHPNCFTDAGYVSNQLTVLNFLVSNDRQYECGTAPVQFFWYDCGDNAISTIDGRLLYLSNHIYNQKYDYKHTSLVDYSFDFADDAPFPTFNGANSTCDTTTYPDYFRFIDFVNGGIDVVCADSIDARGDINLNEIAYEIADAVLLANYFLYGLSVFTVNTDGQITASEVNNDGLTLSIADLVYLIRVLTGDAPPYPKETPIQEITPVYPTVTRVISDGTLNVSKEMGAMLIVIEGDVTCELLNANMTVTSNFDGRNTRMLVYSVENNTFSGDFLKVLGDIVSIEFGSAEGGPVILQL